MMPVRSTFAHRGLWRTRPAGGPTTTAGVCARRPVCGGCLSIASQSTYSADVLAIDHVIVLVEDLDMAARRYDEQQGLASVPGGRHPGHGTANRIVPLGSSYLELMAVVDRVEADSSPLGRWVGRRLVEVGEAPAALCLRTDDLEGATRLTGSEPVSMHRTRPDGVQLDWRLVALDAALTEGLPFFIQWLVDEVDHPGRAPVDHGCAAVGIDWVELGGDHDRLARWLGPHELPLRQVEGAPGPRRVAVAVANGEPIVIG
jgi:hypothetical protein